MKKVLTIKYMLAGYRFARSIEDLEMMEEYYFGIMEAIKGKPKFYKRFILRRMRKDFREMTQFKVLRFLTSKKL